MISFENVKTRPADICPAVTPEVPGLRLERLPFEPGHLRLAMRQDRPTFDGPAGPGAERVFDAAPQ